MERRKYFSKYTVNINPYEDKVQIKFLFTFYFKNKHYLSLLNVHLASKMKEKVRNIGKEEKYF